MSADSGEPHHTSDDGGRPPAAVVGLSSGLRSGRVKALGASIFAGATSAAIGTALHAHVWHAGAFAVPLGALGAVLFSTCVAVFAALWARSVLVAAATGGIAYALVGLLTVGASPELIVAGVQVEGNTPVVSMAGYIWVIGLALGTIAAVALSWLVLRPGEQGTAKKEL